ncbi:hypothetical protein ACFV24_32880 [Nocardia fluminea]|uniref:hypothetical protein n=1 Tax=Nocardia fluminea TaxID=134984 RepID=UPI00366DD5AC
MDRSGLSTVENPLGATAGQVELSARTAVRARTGAQTSGGGQPVYRSATAGQQTA